MRDDTYIDRINSRMRRDIGDICEGHVGARHDLGDRGLVDERSVVDKQDKCQVNIRMRRDMGRGGGGGD